MRAEQTDDSDAALVLAAREGDKGAFAWLLARHRPLLEALCRRALGDPALAEDAAQEATLQALLGLDHLRHPDQFGPWLGGIGLNICRRWRRERAREGQPWEALWNGRPPRGPAADRTADPAALAEEAELREWVRHAVATLPPGQRAAVTLFYLSGLTQAETAVALGIETGAVKGRLHKARGALRRRLANVGKEKTMTADVVNRPVEVEIMTIRRSANQDPPTNYHAVVLEEVGGGRRLPLWIGASECQALAQTLTKTELPRPLPYALTASLVAALGGQVREVALTGLVKGIVYATVVVDGPGGSVAWTPARATRSTSPCSPARRSAWTPPCSTQSTRRWRPASRRGRGKTRRRWTAPTGAWRCSTGAGGSGHGRTEPRPAALPTSSPAPRHGAPGVARAGGHAGL